MYSQLYKSVKINFPFRYYNEKPKRNVAAFEIEQNDDNHDNIHTVKCVFSDGQNESPRRKAAC